MCFPFFFSKNSVYFSESAYYSGIVLVPEFDFLEAVPDKASVGHVKVNIIMYIHICQHLWDKLSTSGMPVLL